MHLSKNPSRHSAARPCHPSLQGVENVYTQHTPPLVGVLERLARGRLAEIDYPRVDTNRSPTAPKVSHYM